MPKVNFEASAHGKNLWVAVGEDVAAAAAAIYTSPTPDFNNATKRTSANNNVINCIVSGKDKFVCGHNNGQFSYSLDGINWQVSNVINYAGGWGFVKNVEYDNNKFVAIGGTNIFHSDDGITWNVIDISAAAGGLLDGSGLTTGGNFQGCLTYNSHQNKWFAISSHIIFESGDGENWAFDAKYHDGGVNAKFPAGLGFKGLDCNPNNGFMVASATDGYAVYDPAQPVATRWSWFAANAAGPALESAAGPHHFEGVIYANDKFYIGGKDKMGTEGVGTVGGADDKAIFWEGDDKGANWEKVDTGTLLGVGQIITGFSFSDNSLLITCDENILHLPIQGGREILLGGNISVENNLSTKGCHISIEGVSEHGNKDTEMKLVLHGDLEVSNKKISIESNDDANKLEVKGNSKIDQDLTSDSTQPVTFHSVQVTKGLATAVTVATVDDIDYEDEYVSNLAGGTTADQKIDALLLALGITTAAGGASGSGSDGQIVNGLVKIRSRYGSPSIYLNVNTADFDTALTVNDKESELALTDINGNFSLSAAVTTRLTSSNDFFIEIHPITDGDLRTRNTYVGQVVTMPTYDKQADERINEVFSNVLPQGDYTDKNIAITPLTTIKSKMVENGGITFTVAHANDAVKATFNITDDELNEVDPYSVLEEPDATKRDKAKKVLDRISEVMTITDSIVASTKTTGSGGGGAEKNRDDVFAKIADVYKANTTTSIIGTGADANKIKDGAIDNIVYNMINDVTEGENIIKVAKNYLFQARATRVMGAAAGERTVEKFKKRIEEESKFVRALKELKNRTINFNDFEDTPDAAKTEFIKDEIDSKEELTFTKSTPIAWELNDNDNVESTEGHADAAVAADNFTATYRVITDGNATITLNNISNLTVKTKYKKNRITISVTNIPVGEHVLELKAKIPEASEDLAVFKKINIKRNPAAGASVDLPEPVFTTQETEIEQADDNDEEKEVLDIDINGAHDEVQIEDIEDPDKEKVTNVSREFQIKDGVKKNIVDGAPNSKVRGLFVRPRKIGIYKISIRVRKKAHKTMIVRKIIFLVVKAKYREKEIKIDVAAGVSADLFWNSSKISIETTKTTETKRAMEIIKQIRNSTLYNRLPFTVSFDGFDGTKAIIKMKGKVAKNTFNFFYSDWVYDFTPFTLLLPAVNITSTYRKLDDDTLDKKIINTGIVTPIALLELPAGYDDAKEDDITWTVVGDGGSLHGVDGTNNKIFKSSKTGTFKITVNYSGKGANAPATKESTISINVASKGVNKSIFVNTNNGEVFGYTTNNNNVFTVETSTDMNNDPIARNDYKIIKGANKKSLVSYSEGGKINKDAFRKLFTLDLADKDTKIDKIKFYSPDPTSEMEEVTSVTYAAFNP